MILEEGEIMKSKHEYEGYIIEAMPGQLMTGEWNTSLRIIKDSYSGTTSKQYISSDTYKTKEEAIKANLIFGKNIIDGTVPECSVDF